MFTVVVLPLDLRVAVDETETIIDGLRRRGVRTPYACRRGGCGACKCQLLDGAVRYDKPVADSVLSTDERDLGLCLPCRAIPTSDVVIDVDRARIHSVLAATPSSTPAPKEVGQQCQ